MKQLLLLILSLNIFLFTACEKENSLNEIEITKELATFELSDAPEKFSLPVPEPEPDPFEIQLQWTSYITAIVLINHPDIANDVNGMILLNGNVIQITDLVESTMSPDVNDFNTLFWVYLNALYHPGRPNHDVVLPGGIAENPEQVIFQADVISFIISITQEECVELFFPNDLELTQGPATEFTSTAHPLTLALTNYGYIHNLSFVGGNASEANFLKTVNAGYVANNENIIIARPYRHFEDCLYEQYDGIVFTQYLNN